MAQQKGLRVRDRQKKRRNAFVGPVSPWPTIFVLKCPPKDNAVYWISLELKYEKKNSNETTIGSLGSDIAFSESVFFKGLYVKVTWEKAFPQAKSGFP
ncbi:hypothetical protein VP1G_11162 [Cytospora mali]|uniref:Uncharacterized protein n=1 Tax=Cytospora mali TaxID=578113 RepID=A0A194V894_CYTMA|nr:hypothetical protein VP1G_11162 [Valsa mali var. pyri (nom. inval.)]